MTDSASSSDLLSELFQLLNPEIMGEKYSSALEKGDTPTLITLTANYFRTRKECSYCKTIDLSACSLETAERAVKGDVTVVNLPHAFPAGKIDWRFNPTLTEVPVNHEWLWQLNRMNFWRDMVWAYGKTGDEKYPAAFNEQLQSWIATADSPDDNWNAPGSLWRTIEAGLRMMYAWPLTFEVFRKSPAFTDENICLMLSSMHRHCLHLQAHHKERNNWLLMEMSGLYTFAVLFPEFKCSVSMRRYAVEKFSQAVMLQILPDGMHDELSPDYHGVLLMCAMSFCNIAAAEKIKVELPEDFLKKLELSFESILDMATPALTSPRTNDCFTCHVSKRMKQALKLFPGRKDFLWGASERKEGDEPRSLPTSSRFLPWAGFAVMRSDWSADAGWCCFDVGPLGMGHIHQDKLNIQIYKGSQELIYDDGGGQYEHSIYRAYGVNSSSHNTILVDGMVQRRTAPRKVDSPIECNWVSNAEFDYAKGIYDDEYGPLVLCEEDLKTAPLRPVKHTREVRFYKPDFFCIKDTLVALDDLPHTYELRFHLDTLKMEQTAQGAWISDFQKEWDIFILPLYPGELTCKLLSGVDTPPMGGWFVGRNDLTLHKSTTLTMTVTGKKDHTFATLLIPVKRGTEMPQTEKRSANCFALRLNNREYLIDLENLSK